MEAQTLCPDCNFQKRFFVKDERLEDGYYYHTLYCLSCQGTFKIKTDERKVQKVNGTVFFLHKPRKDL